MIDGRPRPAANPWFVATAVSIGGWVELGGTDEQKPANDGTVEAWGQKKGLRGRFGVYPPPRMEELGLCELEHNPKNNRIRAKR